MEENQNKKFYKCNFPGCDMIFTKKCVLRDHQMAHKREKPYKNSKWACFNALLAKRS